MYRLYKYIYIERESIYGKFIYVESLRIIKNIKRTYVSYLYGPQNAIYKYIIYKRVYIRRITNEYRKEKSY